MSREQTYTAPTSRMLHCIFCGKPHDNAMPADADRGPISTPHGATKFYTYGHYGSTFWDSFDGEQLVIVICDDHLRAAARDQIAAIRAIREHPTRYEEIEHHPELQFNARDGEAGQ